MVEGIFGHFFEKVEVADHDGEEVIEVVSDAARELSDAFHFEGLLEFGFGLFAFGDIACDGDDGFDGSFFGAKNGSATGFDPDPVSAFVLHAVGL